MGKRTMTNTKEYKHDLNDTADILAGTYRKAPDPTCIPHRAPLLSPCVEARILYGNSAITSKLYELTAYELCYRQLNGTIQKNSSWSAMQFGKVDWDAYKAALKSLTGSFRIMMAKTADAIVNTNTQNAQFYRSSAMCPCCHTAKETLTRVFTCSQADVILNRAKSQNHLLLTLRENKSSPPICEAIKHGLDQWYKQQSSPTLPIHALTV